MLSTASTYTFAVALIAGFIPSVKADCGRGNLGPCDRLSNTARIIIGVIASVIILAALLSLSVYCRRRNNRDNLARIQQTQQGSGAGGYYGGSAGPYYGGSTGAPPAPQYPAPAHNKLNVGSPYTHNPTTGSASPSDAPPMYYPQPPGEPQITTQK